MALIDLREWADKNRYHWRCEEGHSASETDAQWFVEVICRHGLIYPYGGDTLLCYAHRGVKRRIGNLGAKHHQWDDDSEVFRFPSSLLDSVATILKPKRLPGQAQLTDEHRQILLKHAFKAGKKREE